MNCCSLILRRDWRRQWKFSIRVFNSPMYICGFLWMWKKQLIVQEFLFHKTTVFWHVMPSNLVEEDQEPATSIFNFTQKVVPPICWYLSVQQCHILEDSSVHTHCHKNFRSCVALFMVPYCTSPSCHKLNYAWNSLL